MKYFIDTEFIEGFWDAVFYKKRHFIDLISIGIVAEDGRKYQAISKEYNYNDANNWVKENVIMPLYKSTVSGDQRNRHRVNNFHKFYGLTNEQIKEDITDFVKAFPCKEEPDLMEYDNNIEFYGYYSDYDWVLFCSLFGRMIDLPKGFPMYCIDLKQMLDETAATYTSKKLSSITYPTVSHNVLEYLGNTGTLDKVKHLKNHPDYPKQENEHNALDDAKWNYELYKFLQSVK